MSHNVVVGTRSGLYEVGGGVTALDGLTVAHVVGGWAVADGRLWRRTGGAWSPVAAPGGGASGGGAAGGGAAGGGVAGGEWAPTCVAPAGDGALVGGDGAHLWDVDGSGAPRRDEPFESAPTRAEWHTPWGGPPAVRSIAVASDGTRYVNVHVGGILRSRGAGASAGAGGAGGSGGAGGASAGPGGSGAWEPTIDLHTDVHQVVTVGDGVVLAALGAGGLGVSRDRGASWQIRDAGLHARYCRAVAVAGDTVLLSASTGPGGRRSAVYRAPLDGDGAFERCVDGLPEWFDDNVDTHCLAADGDVAVVGTASGEVYRSDDAGRRWTQVASGLPAIRCVALQPA